MSDCPEDNEVSKCLIQLFQGENKMNNSKCQHKRSLICNFLPLMLYLKTSLPKQVLYLFYFKLVHCYESPRVSIK